MLTLQYFSAYVYVADFKYCFQVDQCNVTITVMAWLVKTPNQISIYQ